jgi:hypothetical protein
MIISLLICFVFLLAVVVLPVMIILYQIRNHHDTIDYILETEYKNVKNMTADKKIIAFLKMFFKNVKRHGTKYYIRKS